jgi:alpha-L-fucosidase 2
MSGDETLLRETLFPVLRRAVNYHRHFLHEGADGRLHLPETRSPEYKSGPDCNYDLALLRWGAQTLLRAAEILKIQDPLAGEWKRIVEKLADYPEDPAQGFLIAHGVPLDSSHRHYSHLLMVYPLHLVNPEQPGGAERIRRSLDHWHSFPEALQGYSYAGGASMAALLRDGDQALAYLNGLQRFIQPNTMYREAGPVIETPLSAAQSIHDMLLQSWDAPDGPLIRVFPAAPDAWPDVTFHQWRAEGAFLVSAARAGGRTAWVRVTSLRGVPCRIHAEFSGSPRIDGPEGLRIESQDGNRYGLFLAQDQTITLIDPAYEGEVVVKPVAGSTSQEPIFGLPGD